MDFIQKDLGQTGLVAFELEDGSDFFVPLYSQNLAEGAREFKEALFKSDKIDFLLETLNYKVLNRTIAALRVYKNKGFLAEDKMRELRTGFGDVDAFLPPKTKSFLYA